MKSARARGVAPFGALGNDQRGGCASTDPGREVGASVSCESTRTKAIFDVVFVAAAAVAAAVSIVVVAVVIVVAVGLTLL